MFCDYCDVDGRIYITAIWVYDNGSFKKNLQFITLTSRIPHPPRSSELLVLSLKQINSVLGGDAFIFIRSKFPVLGFCTFCAVFDFI